MQFQGRIIFFFTFFYGLTLHGACIAQDRTVTASQTAMPVPQEPMEQKVLQDTPASEKATTILSAATQYKGTEYVFGGRLGKRGCKRNGKRIQCRAGIDCQSLIFFAFEDTGEKRWWEYSVMPTISVKRGEFGQPVPGLDGVLRKELEPTLFAPGDVVFFLLEDYNFDVDGPLHEQDGRRYGTWHTGFYYGLEDGIPQVLHAAPGEVVKIQPLQDIAFDALYAVRM